MSDRHRLRPIQTDDWRAVHDWAKLPDSCRYQAWGPNTEAETRAFADRAAAAWAADPVRDRTYLFEVDGEPAGTGVLHVRGHRRGEISYAVHPRLWGRGLGTTLAEGLLRIGFAELDLHRIFATCDPRNAASAAILRRVGMIREGRMRDAVLISGGWRDSELYAILRPEWRTRP